MAYIDREAAIQRLMAPKPDSPDLTPFCLCLGDRIDVQRFLEFCPDADVSPVVRCRECKYWGDEDGKLQSSDGVLFARCKIHNYLLDGRHTGWCPTENDFCSYGERKDGDD